MLPSFIKWHPVGTAMNPSPQTTFTASILAKNAAKIPTFARTASTTTARWIMSVESRVPIAMSKKKNQTFAIFLNLLIAQVARQKASTTWRRPRRHFLRRNKSFFSSEIDSPESSLQPSVLKKAIFLTLNHINHEPQCSLEFFCNFLDQIFFQVSQFFQVPRWGYRERHWWNCLSKISRYT